MKASAIAAGVMEVSWGALLARGLLALTVGAVCFVVPGVSLAALVLGFAAYALVDGVLSLVHAFQRNQAGRRGALLFEGLLHVAVGIGAFALPSATVVALVYVLAFWAFVSGALKIAAAVRLRRVIEGEWLLALSGVISIGFGVVLVFFPVAGALTLVIWLGAYAVLLGLLLVVLAFRARSWQRTTRAPASREMGHPA